MQYTTHQAIIRDYVNTISKGLITLGAKHCQTILNLSKHPYKMGEIEMYQWHELKANYTPKHKARISENTINEVIEKQKSVKPIECFFMYKCYNEAGDLLQTIYSLNPSLFDTKN